MRTIQAIGILCIAAVSSNASPLFKNDQQGGFKYPNDIPSHFLEAREPDSFNAIYNKGGIGAAKAKREDQPTTGGSESSGSGSGGNSNPMNQISTQVQSAIQQLSSMGGNMPFLNGNKQKREDQPATGGSESTGSGSGSSGNSNPMNQISTQVQSAIQQLSSMGGNMPFLNGNKQKREDQPATGGSESSGSGSSGNSNPMNQISTQVQSALQQLSSMGGNMPFLNGNKQKREDQPATGGSESSGSGSSGNSNPMNQISTQVQSAIQQLSSMGGNMPFLNGNKQKREDQPATGGSESSGSGSSGNSNPMNQISTQVQSAIQQLSSMGGNMPFLNGNKQKREDQPATGGSESTGSGSGSGGNSNPMNQISTQVQSAIQQLSQMGGNMPFLNNNS